MNIGQHNCGTEHIRFVCLQRSANCKKVSRNSNFSFITVCTCLGPWNLTGSKDNLMPAIHISGEVSFHYKNFLRLCDVAVVLVDNKKIQKHNR